MAGRERSCQAVARTTALLPLSWGAPALKVQCILSPGLGTQCGTLTHGGVAVASPAHLTEAVAATGYIRMVSSITQFK
jgi:hypothetical protein